jgi:YD repeat-containing protein
MRRLLLLLFAGLTLLTVVACGSYEPLHKGGIDPSTGLYTREDEDIVVFDTLPLVLRRTYLAGDRVSRQFGVGGTHPGDWYLIGDGATYQWAELILSTGGRIHFDRTSPSTSGVDPVFEHRSTPTEFFGSQLRRDPAGWALRFTDGRVAVFKRCPPGTSEVCSIMQMRDANGHRIDYLRDGSGLLRKMQGDTHSIAFEYDAARRIVVARDSLEHVVRYTYDAGGHLVRVLTSDGNVRAYTYGARGEMLTIDEPGWRIENEYDGAGRVVRQTTRFPGDDDPAVISLAYTVRDGSVVHTHIVEYDGTHTRQSYNRHHYLLAEIFDADGFDPISVSYDRNETTNLTSAVSIQCRGASGPVALTVPIASRFEQLNVKAAIDRACGGTPR